MIVVDESQCAHRGERKHVNKSGTGIFMLFVLPYLSPEKRTLKRVQIKLSQLITLIPADC